MNVYSDVYSEATREALRRLGDHLILSSEQLSAPDDDPDAGVAAVR
jgi:hypothetical protein